MDQTLIDVNIERFQYNDNEDCLRDISLQIKKGEFIVITGLSGCGKSTLIRIINGLIPEYYDGIVIGDVKFKGRSISQYKKGELAKYMGNVFQDPKDQFFSTQVEDEIALVGENLGMNRSTLFERVEKAIEVLDLKDLRDKSVFELSGGEKQRVAIASSLVYDTDVIIFDEPSASLDYVSTLSLKSILKQLKEMGKTIIIPLFLSVKFLKQMMGGDSGDLMKQYMNSLQKERLLHWLDHLSLAEKLRKLPLSYFGKKDLSDLTNTIMNDCADLEKAFSHAIPQFIGAIISTALIIIGLLVKDWRMGLGLLWVFPVALIIIIGSKKLQKKGALKHYKAKRACADGIQECFETIQDIKSYNREEVYLAGLDKKLDKAEKAQISSELALGILINSAQIVLKLGLATVILVGSNMLIKGQTDFLTYLMFLIAASRIYDPIIGVFCYIAQIFYVDIRINRMREIENQIVQEGVEDYATNGYDIVFEHVGFSYDEGETVLKDVSFTAKQGEVTALVGPSGGGKSTAAKLAARFWDVDKGKIILGGVDVSTIDPEALLKNYAIVFQDVVLFNGTVMENIQIGRRDATREEVMEVAKIAMCDEFVSRLPQGYDTVIGENGASLSGGERQRISIARAILKDAPIILLDEATASLDVENETKIQIAISQLIENKTVLIIAHRMRTVANADKVVVLEDGYVAQQGRPEELMDEGGLYKHMVELQNQSLEWELNFDKKAMEIEQ